MRVPDRLRAIAAIVGILLLPPSGKGATGEEPRQHDVDPCRIPRATSTIRVDAILDEQAWRDALRVELNYEIEPGENIAPPVRAEALITFDDRSLYVAFRAFDPEPAKIRAHVADRDQVSADDLVGLVLDTFNDKRRGYEFLVNPLGVQWDLFRNELSNGEPEDASWDAIWESAGRITAEGFVVEMAIPFNQLRFPRTDGEQTWRIGFYRAYPRNLRHRIFHIPMDRNNNCFTCQLPEFTGMQGITPGRNIELIPTVTSQRDDALEDEDDLTSQYMHGSFHTEAGLSARWGITPNLSLNAALNPDFSQVEPDTIQLATNTRFALFYPEKRPFFLEGADLFSAPMPVVYTRAVADPRWGLKLSGKAGKQALGVFVAKDRITELIFPANQSSDSMTLEQENTAAVVRYRHDLGESSTLGLLATSRVADRYSNRVFGLDGHVRLSRNDTVQFQLLGSQTRYPEEVAANYDQPKGSFDGSALQLLCRRDTRDWGLWLYYQDLGKGFRADSGFVPRVDTKTVNPGVGRTLWGEKGDWYTRINIYIEGVRTTDHTGSPTDENVILTGRFEGPMQSLVQIRAARVKEYYEGATYDQDQLSVTATARPTGNLSWSLDSRFGDAVDYDNARPARVTHLAPGLKVDFGRHLTLQVDHIFEDLNVADGRLYRANLSQLRVVYQFNLRTFARAMIQRLNVERNVNLYTKPQGSPSRELFTQLLFSYKFDPQTAFFVGYSDTHAGNERVDVTQKNRTFFVKIGYDWQP